MAKPTVKDASSPLTKQTEPTMSNTEKLAKAQKCGYLNRDEWKEFEALLRKAQIQVEKQVLRDVIIVRMNGRKFYTEA